MLPCSRFASVGPTSRRSWHGPIAIPNRRISPEGPGPMRDLASGDRGDLSHARLPPLPGPPTSCPPIGAPPAPLAPAGPDHPHPLKHIETTATSHEFLAV